MKQIVYYQSNANSYAFQSKAKFVFDSDQEEQYEFRGSNIVRTQKSMSMVPGKQNKQQKPTKQMKKSNSFLLVNKPKAQSNKTIEESKDKSKTSKKCLNIAQGRKKPPINSKNSMNKTSVSINSISIKSTKTLKKRSVSRDYLMLDEEIYQCQNIQQINEKLVCGGSQVYSHERFIKATLKNQQRLQNYLTSFAQYIKYTCRNHLDINQMTQQQKKKLYLLLKSQNIGPLHKQSLISKQNKKLLQNSFTMQNLIKQAVHKIQKKTKQVLNQRPQQQRQIKKWKNQKLHQLMALHTCLSQQNKSSERMFQNLISEDQQQIPIIKKVQKRKNKQQKPIKEKNDEKKQKAESYIKKSHITQQRYPEEIINKLDEVKKYLPDEHILSSLGIQNFLHCFWDFLVDNQRIGQLASNLRSSYAVSESDKRLLLSSKNTQNIEQWTAFLILSTKNILNDQLFIQFCKSTNVNINLYQDQLSQEQRKAVIIFQKSIFDCLNIQLSKFQTDYPYGPFHPLQSNTNNTAYMIDQQNAMQVWDQCIHNILDDNKIGMGVIFDTQCEQSQTIKKQKQQAFKLCFKKQISNDMWQRSKPLIRRNNLEQIMKSIEQDLYNELNDELKNF